MRIHESQSSSTWCRIFMLRKDAVLRMLFCVTSMFEGYLLNTNKYPGSLMRLSLNILRYRIKPLWEPCVRQINLNPISLVPLARALPSEGMWIASLPSFRSDIKIYNRTL